MANDKEVDAKARVNMHHLLGEMAVAIMKLHQETPAMLAVRHEVPSIRLLLTPYKKTMEEEQEEEEMKQYEEQ